ncbi:MAG: type II toxin-antitoxin system VapC family toxin [Candidatus Cloacimonadota bacterium]|nr:type II toxin-antitoxin system VapC family toxin [Candidatus Cloacimonadota bacterium]
MSGNRFLLDTNCIIELLQNNNKGLLNKLENANIVAVSIISKIEFLAFPKINESDKKLFSEFIKLIDVIDLRNIDQEIIDLTIEIRHTKNLKLPDSIILATAKSMNAILLTRDKKLLKAYPSFVTVF